MPGAAVRGRRRFPFAALSGRRRPFPSVRAERSGRRPRSRSAGHRTSAASGPFDSGLRPALRANGCCCHPCRVQQPQPAVRLRSRRVQRSQAAVPLRSRRAQRPQAAESKRPAPDICGERALRLRPSACAQGERMLLPSVPRAATAARRSPPFAPSAAAAGRGVEAPGAGLPREPALRLRTSACAHANGCSGLRARCRACLQSSVSPSRSIQAWGMCVNPMRG